MGQQLDSNNTKIEDTMEQLVVRVNEIEQNGNQTCVIREDKNISHEVPHMKGYIKKSYGEMCIRDSVCVVCLNQQITGY